MTIINPKDTHWTVTIEGSILYTEGLQYNIEVYIPIKEIGDRDNFEIVEEINKKVLENRYGFRVSITVLHMLDDSEWILYEE